MGRRAWSSSRYNGRVEYSTLDTGSRDIYMGEAAFPPAQWLGWPFGMRGPVGLFIQMGWGGEVDMDVVVLCELPRRCRVAGRSQ